MFVSLLASHLSGFLYQSSICDISLNPICSITHNQSKHNELDYITTEWHDWNGMSNTSEGYLPGSSQEAERTVSGRAPPTETGYASLCWSSAPANTMDKTLI